MEKQESVTAGRPAIDSAAYEKQVNHWLEVDKWKPEEVTATKLQKKVGGQYNRAKAFLENFMAGYQSKQVSDIPEPPARFLDALVKAGYDLNAILQEEKLKADAEKDEVNLKKIQQVLAGKSEVEERLNEIIIDKDDLKEKLAVLQRKYDDQAKELGLAEKDKIQLDKDKVVLEKEKESVQKQLDSSIRMSGSYHDEIKELKGKVNDKDSKLEELNEKVEHLHQRIEDNKVELSDSEKKSVGMEALQEKYTTLKAQYNKDQDRIGKLETEIKEERNQNKTLAGAVVELKEERQGKDARMKLLESQVETLASERNASRDRVSDLEKKVINLMTISKPKTKTRKEKEDDKK